MKHPSYRVADILFMDSEVREKLFKWAWDLCHTLPFASEIKDVEMVGSYAFGCATVFSDIDFNIAMHDWNDQVPARRWFYARKNRAGLVGECVQFEKREGLKVDIGCVDCETTLYNISASLKENKLYNRGIEKLPDYGTCATSDDPARQEPLSVIDMSTFKSTDPQPPVTVMHLRFDSYAFRWYHQPRLFERRGGAVDNFAHEVPFWKERYGERFLDGN